MIKTKLLVYAAIGLLFTTVIKGQENPATYDKADLYVLDEDDKKLKEHEFVVTPMDKRTASVNLVGFLMFGPTVSLEYAVSSDAYLDLHTRVGSMGLLYWGIHGFPQQLYGISLGTGIRKYLPGGKNNKVYLGTTIELDYARAYHDDRETKNINIPVFANFGYRFRFDAGTFFNLGLYGGPVVPIDNYYKYDSGSSVKYKMTPPPFVAFLEVSFGWKF